MSIFGRSKKPDGDAAGKDDIYIANPHFYKDADGSVFGSFAMTEGTLSFFPLDPKKRYRVEGKDVEVWKLCLISTTKDGMVGMIDYYPAMEKLKACRIREYDGGVLIRGLSLDELCALADQ